MGEGALRVYLKSTTALIRLQVALGRQIDGAPVKDAFGRHGRFVRGCRELGVPESRLLRFEAVQSDGRGTHATTAIVSALHALATVTNRTQRSMHGVKIRSRLLCVAMASVRVHKFDPVTIGPAHLFS
eukprot:3944625-Pleurochrysis_carterae.AAC.1